MARSHPKTSMALRDDSIAAHRLDLAQVRLDTEIVLKDSGVFLTDSQQACHSVIWDVVPEVPGGDRGSKPA